MPARSEQLAHLRLAAELARIDVGELVLPEDQHIVVDGLRLHCLDWGRQDRPPLLFLHGGRLTAHTWDLVCLALRTEYHCIALDQRGHGDSDWSPTLDYGPAAHARDIGGLIEQLELRNPVLLGQSLGGLNALTYAIRHAGELAGLVAIDVAPEVQRRGTERVINFTWDPDPGSLDDFVRNARAFNPRRDPRLLRYSLLHNLRRLPEGTWTWRYDRRRMTGEYFATLMATLEALGERARQITCPVLVVRGDESDVLSNAQAARFAESLPDGRWATVPAAGHNVQGDNPRELLPILSTFLAGLAGC